MFFACLVKYVGECLVCVMYVCRWLYCSEGIFCILCEFVPVCLPVVSGSVVLCVCCRSVLIVILVGGLNVVHGLSSSSFCCIVRMIWW